MLKKFIFSLTAIMALSLVVMAQDTKGATDGKSATTEGFIVDQHCSAGDLANHGKGCVLSANCLKSGLGFYANGKFTPFDEKSSPQAKAALEKSKKDKGAKFKVTGKVIDGKMSVEKIEEVG